MAIKNKKQYRRFKIKMRIRKVVKGTAERPRLTVFRSNKEIYTQLIDDVNGKTVAAASSTSSELQSEKGTKTEIATKVGKLTAQRALEAGVQAVVFDRNGYLYHGRVKAVAEGAREGGLKL